MHNNIMAAGSKDRPPMLGPGRYSQWRSRFLRYIDTKGNGEYLRKCIFEGPYKLTSVVIEAVAATVNSPEVPQHDEAETIHNMSEENKCIFKRKTVILNSKLRGDKDRQRNLAILAKYFKKLTNHTNNNLRNLLQTPGTRLTDIHILGVHCIAVQADCRGHKRKRLIQQELEAHYSFMAKIQEVLPEESSSTDQPLKQVQNHDENNVFANERRHSVQPESINDTYVLEKEDSKCHS
ncbi:hypothetical protein Tco_0321043 [Tanacetum coccineum]